MRRPGASPEVVGAMVASPLIGVHVRLSESKAIGAWVGSACRRRTIQLPV